MWCPNCEKDFDTQEHICPQCGGRMKKNSLKAQGASWVLSTKESPSDNWPCREDGKPESPALLTHCTAVNMEDKMMINMLIAFGIPVLKIDSESGGAGKIILGMSGFGTDIYVPESLLEDAKALMEENPDE